MCFKQKSHKLTSGNKPMCSFFKQIDIVLFLNFCLNKLLEFLNFLAGLVLVSYKSVSYKNTCIIDVIYCFLNRNDVSLGSRRAFS